MGFKKKWKWVGELYFDTRPDEARRLCEVRVTDAMSEGARGVLRFDLVLCGDSLRLSRLHEIADFIKIMCGGGVASPTVRSLCRKHFEVDSEQYFVGCVQDAIETVQFTAEEIQAITTTCKQMGGKHSESYNPLVKAR